MSTLAEADRHGLAPLFEPASIALVGASQREGSVGNLMVEVLRRGGFAGTVTCINPRYQDVADYPCVPSLADLPGPPDLAVLSVAAHRMEAAMIEAIDAGARGAVIFDPCFFDGDSEPRLLDRLKAIAREASIPVCGGNGMGYFNFDHRSFVSFQHPVTKASGGITAVCHSGSVFALLVHSGARYRFNLVTSPGQEIGLTAAQTMDYALDLPTTRVIVLFVEAIRDPDRFVAALEKARDRGVPVVATKVARTEASAALAATHSGALAGSDSAFGALCDRYGVIRTDDLDGMMATAQVLGMETPVGEGGFGAVLDSGGLREQMIDLADDLNVPFAALTDETVAALKAQLAFGLEAINPLDAAGPLTDDFVDRFNAVSLALAQDPGIGLMAHELFIDDHLCFYPGVLDGMKAMPVKTGKPHVLVTSLATTENAGVVGDFVDRGIPVINGARPLLVAAKAALAWRDFRARDDDDAAPANPEIVDRWRKALSGGTEVDEVTALRLLADFGVPTVQSALCASADEVLENARLIGFPVVMKTAEPNLNHKSDVDGVRLGLADDRSVGAAYDDIAQRLGPQVSVAAMAPKGIELGFGMVRDAQFGPVVVVSAGGVLIEVLDDRTFALPPFGLAHAHRLIAGLKVAKLLEGVRGAPPADCDALARALSQFSVLAAALGDVIGEMDVNPIIAGPEGAVAVDALVVTDRA